MYRTIVVGYDGGRESRDAVALARLLARPETRIVAARIAVAHPRNPEDGVPPTDVGEDVELRVVPGKSAARGLHDLALELDADALVVGSTRRGTLGRVLLGSTAETLLGSAPCAVAVAPRGLAEDAPDQLRVIGLGYDASPESEAALRTVGELASRLGATVRVITVVEPPAPTGAGLSYGYGEAELGIAAGSARERLDEALDQLDPAIRPLGVKRRGDPATVLADEAERGMDVLFVGSRGYGPVRQALLGGVSHKLMRLAPCPVVVVPREAAPLEELPSASQPAAAGPAAA